MQLLLRYFSPSKGKIIVDLKMKFSLLAFLWSICTFCSYSQDTIINTLGEKIAVQIIDTSGEFVSYIPILSIKKNRIDRIKYLNEKNLNVENVITFNHTKETRTVKELLAKGNKVFIQCKDNGGSIHTHDALSTWNYWEITESIEKCDFILNMDISLKGKAEAHITILSPIDGSIILDIPKSYVLFGDYGNPKKASIIKNIGEKLIPLIKDIEK